ncbi:hypothetical protein H257_04260 [Aphanomyces astaci]|uniref:Uncharacterized protein n=1 Tax=Aphanomyces astaci TaxID=112090 RepID=W4GX38_APHAT|nr:hypothetical protein H257_04260 [Aphanomyces astaci]ETV83554.1 hypothetical protein H257_04260 [Aphanomyces astaci]|eukprot:XP_009826984.1 hypothetical protein H257_04260 [Aphanomyces astaci]
MSVSSRDPTASPRWPLSFMWRTLARKSLAGTFKIQSQSIHDVNSASTSWCCSRWCCKRATTKSPRCQSCSKRPMHGVNCARRVANLDMGTSAELNKSRRMAQSHSCRDGAAAGHGSPPPMDFPSSQFRMRWKASRYISSLPSTFCALVEWASFALDGCMSWVDSYEAQFGGS